MITNKYHDTDIIISFQLNQYHLIILFPKFYWEEWGEVMKLDDLTRPVSSEHFPLAYTELVFFVFPLPIFDYHKFGLKMFRNTCHPELMSSAVIRGCQNYYHTVLPSPVPFTFSLICASSLRDNYGLDLVNMAYLLLTWSYHIFLKTHINLGWWRHQQQQN